MSLEGIQLNGCWEKRQGSARRGHVDEAVMDRQLLDDDATRCEKRQWLQTTTQDSEVAGK